MWFIASALKILFPLASVIDLVQTEPEFLPWTTRLEGVQRIHSQFYIMRIRRCNDQRQRKPVCVRHQAALYAFFPLSVGFRPTATV